MSKFFFLTLILFHGLLTNAQTAQQKTWCNWVGERYGITFRYGTPVNFYTNSSNGGIVFPWSNSYYYSAGGVAYSDSVTADIKFIATPTAVFSRNYDTVTNGYGLIACDAPEKYGIQVVPFVNGQNKFYIIHSFPGITYFGGLQTRCQVYSYATGNQPGIRYSILDMDANNGLGAITQKNLSFWGSEKMVQIRHANGKFLWIVGQGGNGNVTTRVLFDSAGFHALSNQTISFPTEPLASTWSSGGAIDASPTGNRIAITSSNNKRVNIYRFDNVSGDVLFESSVQLPLYAAQVCFSPDGTKLYVSGYQYGNCSASVSKIFQLDFAVPDIQESVFEMVADYNNSTNYNMERVVGNRIFIFSHYLYNQYGPNTQQYFAFEYPNQPKNAASLNKQAFINNGGNIGFPNIPNDIFRQAPEAPVVDMKLAKDTAVCFGSYTLTAKPGYGAYRWSTGETTQSITVTQPGLYSVLSGSFGFTKPTAYGYTQVRSKAKTLDLGNDTTICPKAGFALSVPANYSGIVWQNGDTTHNRSLTYPGGKQSLKAVDENGCSVSDSICVWFQSYPKAEFGNDTTLCAGQTLLLRVEPSIYFSNATYLWQDGSNKDSLKVTGPGRYWGRSTYMGCTVSDTININYISPFSIDLGKDTALCTGDSLKLTVKQQNLRYKWNTGATTQSITVYTAGTYIVQASNNQCTVTDTIQVTYNPFPNFSLGADRQICPGENTLLSAQTTGTFLWSTGATTPSIQTAQPGLYWLQVTKAGCSSRDSLVVIQKPLPVVQLGKDTTLCEGTTKLLSVFNAGATYLWQDGFTSADYTVSGPGTYFVMVTLNGCVQRDTISIQYLKPPYFQLRGDTVICSGTTLLLQPPFQNGKYTWQDGSTATNYTVKKPGVYKLNVENVCGSFTDEVEIKGTLCELLMPNAFTPNGDGLNDLFRIKFPEFFRSFELTVYNRRGEIMFQTTQAKQGWDGNFKGRAMPTENYVWRISYTDLKGVNETKWGTVLLIR